MPARWPTSEIEVSHNPRWPTVSLSVSSAKAAEPVAIVAVMRTRASGRASLVMAVLPAVLFAGAQYYAAAVLSIYWEPKKSEHSPGNNSGTRDSYIGLGGRKKMRGVRHGSKEKAAASG